MICERIGGADEVLIFSLDQSQATPTVRYESN